jgi:hypothetical protein
MKKLAALYFAYLRVGRESDALAIKKMMFGPRSVLPIPD